MNKRIIALGLLILGFALVFRLFATFGKNLKIDEFRKASVVFILDSSESNQKTLPEQIQYIKSLCAILDPEDAIKILKVSDSSYLIYEGTPGDNKGITKAIGEFIKNEGQDNGTAYAEAIKKAVEHSLTMKKEGYVPSIVVVGDLSDDGNPKKVINWDVLPKNIEKTKQFAPELAMMFVYAPPQKLDLAKTKLNPVLGEKKLIIANSANTNKANSRFLKAIGR